MKIISKHEAEKLHTESLFQRGGTYTHGTYCKGQYEGNVKDYIGHEVPDIPGVIAVYPAKQNGYVTLKSIKQDQKEQ